MKRVVFLAIAPFVGGAERSMLDLAEAMRATGRAEVYVAGSAATCSAARKRNLLTFPIPTPRFERWTARAGKLLEIPGAAACASAASRAISVFNADVVHANGAKSALIGLTAARMRGAHTVWHVRDDVQVTWTHRFLLQTCAGAICPSRFLADSLRAMKSDARVHVSANGFADAQPPTPSARENILNEFGDAPQTRYVTMVAQMIPWKRCDLFLNAAAQIANRRKNVRFLVVGIDPWGRHVDYARELKSLAETPDLQGRVRFLGERDDVDAILAASSVLASPSRREPFGRVIVEAWRAGVPVVASDDGGPAELIKDNEAGVTFASGDASELAAAVERVLDDSELSARLIAAGRRAIKAYNIARHAEETLRIYGELGL